MQNCKLYSGGVTPPIPNPVGAGSSRPQTEYEGMRWYIGHGGIIKGYYPEWQSIEPSFNTQLEAINWLIDKANQNLIDYANGDVH